MFLLFVDLTLKMYVFDFIPKQFKCHFDYETITSDLIYVLTGDREKSNEKSQLQQHQTHTPKLLKAIEIKRSE